MSTLSAWADLMLHVARVDERVVITVGLVSDPDVVMKLPIPDATELARDILAAIDPTAREARVQLTDAPLLGAPRVDTG